MQIVCNFLPTSAFSECPVNMGELEKLAWSGIRQSIFHLLDANLKRYSPYSLFLKECPGVTAVACGRFCAATSQPTGARRWSGGRGRSTRATWTSTSTTRRRTSTRTLSGEKMMMMCVLLMSDFFNIEMYLNPA